MHYYETPTNVKFVMLTDIKSGSMRIALHQIYVSIYVEYVVKNALSPVEHPGGLGVNNELFEVTLEQFVVGLDLDVFIYGDELMCSSIGTSPQRLFVTPFRSRLVNARMMYTVDDAAFQTIVPFPPKRVDLRGNQFFRSHNLIR